MKGFRQAPKLSSARRSRLATPSQSADTKQPPSSLQEPPEETGGQAQDTTKPLGFRLSIAPKKSTPLQSPKSKRPHSSLQDSDDEEAGHAQPQEVSHFDLTAGGAIGANDTKEAKGPLVIQGQKNRDFRDEGRRKRQKNGLPAEAQAARANGVITREPTNGSSGTTAFGLTVIEKSTGEHGQAAIDEGANGVLQVAVAPPKPKTDDELALEALLGNKPESNLVLPAVSEEEAFQRDYKNAPDMATLEQYAAVPVEEFGAALLRGMGWKDGEAVGKRRGQQPVQARVPERRPALLGIGAKSEAAAGIELGAWGKGDKGRKWKDKTYTPVVLRNKKTGEQLTEEELKAKLEEQKLVVAEREREGRVRSRSREPERRVEAKPLRRIRHDEEGDSRRDKDRRKKDRDRSRDRDRDRDYDDRRHKSSRRDRSLSVEGRHRSRKYDDPNDRKDKERRRYEKDERSERGFSRRDYQDRDRDRRR